MMPKNINFRLDYVNIYHPHIFRTYIFSVLSFYLPW